MIEAQALVDGSKSHQEDRPQDKHNLRESLLRFSLGLVLLASGGGVVAVSVDQLGVVEADRIRNIEVINRTFPLPSEEKLRLARAYEDEVWNMSRDIGDPQVRVQLSRVLTSNDGRNAEEILAQTERNRNAISELPKDKRGLLSALGGLVGGVAVTWGIALVGAYGYELSKKRQ